MHKRQQFCRRPFAVLALYREIKSALLKFRVKNLLKKYAYVIQEVRCDEGVQYTASQHLTPG